MMTQEQVLAALSHVIEPDLRKDIVTLGLVSGIEITGENSLKLKVSVANPAMHNKKRMQEAVLFTLQRLLHKDIQAEIDIEALPKDRDPSLRKVLPQVKHIVAIASGKGGVGKSTVTANLAIALKNQGFAVGIIDADIFGPSVPILFDVEDQKPVSVTIDGKSWISPVENHGIKLMSIGFFADPNQAIVWRGPMASKALEQMVKDVYWGELDYLLIDLPPGTSDIHLSMVQAAPLSGVVIVSTPQKVALADAQKGVQMFNLPTLKTPILGIVENMAYFTPEELPNKKYYLFGKDGAKQLAETLHVPFLGEVPLLQDIREHADAGKPIGLEPLHPASKAFAQIALKLHAQLA
jgi:ATP-binding protein involved in chromosome partitioning